jgi:hypothetical protein
MSISPPIYKVNHLVNGNIESIYVFNGIPIDDKIDDSLFQTIFTHKENEFIKKENINIHFSKQTIHQDDSIGTIKIKILNEIKKDISIDEIYLFCQKTEILNAVSVYQSLTQNKKINLTKTRLEQFISNIVSDENGEILKPLDKEIYTFDDIFEMKLNDKKFIMNKVLGQKFLIVENEYPFVCNPFLVKDYDAFFEKNTRKTLSTINNNLLLNTGNIVNNNIYLCLTTNVLEFLSSKDISQETTMKIYYPFLYNKNINNIEDLKRSREKIIENNKKIMNHKVLETFKTIDMFYDIYKLQTSPLNYIESGIKYIKITIRPEFNIKIPLEIIFKILHATEQNPLIKYNPDSRQENIYRLFTDKIATDGRKIPYLKKAIIIKLMKTIARSKSVSVYIENDFYGYNHIIICEFDEYGYITISSEFRSVLSITEINELFKNSINPIIQEIKNLLEQNGYKLKEFNSLVDLTSCVKRIIESR